MAALGPTTRAAWDRAAATTISSASKRARLTNPDVEDYPVTSDDIKGNVEASWNVDNDFDASAANDDGDSGDAFGEDSQTTTTTNSSATPMLLGKTPLQLQRSRSPSKSASGPQRPPPFVAASIATEAAVQATCALSRPVEVLTRAGRLLSKPPMPTSFSDEEDMRRVMSLIYDVFRYKAVLNEVLSETGFFIDNMKLREQEPRVWLLLLDLIGRRFTGRTSTSTVGALLAAAGLLEADAALWARRVPLAAAVARARVRCGALRMSQLLPPRLRDEHLQRAASRPVTGWLNPFVMHNEDPVVMLLEEAGLQLKGPSIAVTSQAITAGGATTSASATTLSATRPPVLATRPWSRGRAPNDHRIPSGMTPCCIRDCACPLFIVCNEVSPSCGACGGNMGTGLAGRTAVRRGALVLLERGRCCGAVALARSVQTLQLAGSVAQTHIVCARTTAYLAALFVDYARVDQLVAYGAGDRKEEFEIQLRALGVPPERVIVRAEAWLRATTDQLERVCAVLASPPGAMAAVLDPVGLACARAGDVALLEAVADAARAAAPPAAQGDVRPEYVEEPPATKEEAHNRRARGALVVDEQRAVLRMAMALPQIQVVVFQTYTLDIGESRDLVTRLVAEANTVARQKRAELAYLMGLRTTAFCAQPADAEGGNAMQSHTMKGVDAAPSDLFEVAPLGETLIPPPEEGCFVTLLRRKEVSVQREPQGDGSEVESETDYRLEGSKKRRARTRAKARARTRGMTIGGLEGEPLESKAARLAAGAAGSKGGKMGAVRRTVMGRSKTRDRRRDLSATGTGISGAVNTGYDRKRHAGCFRTEGYTAPTIASRQRQRRRPSDRKATGASTSSTGRSDSRRSHAPTEEEGVADVRRTRRRRNAPSADSGGTHGRAVGPSAREVSQQTRVRRPLRRVLRLPIASIPTLPHAPARRLPIRIPHRLLLLVV